MTLVTLQASETINDLLSSAYSGRTSNVNKSILLAEEALDLSKSVDDKLLIGKSLNLLSLFYMITSDFENSVKKAKEAILYFKQLDNALGIANAKYNLGSVNYKSNNYHSGLTYLLDALNIYRKHGDLHNQSKVEKAVGTIYEYIGDSSNAFKSYKSAIKNARLIGDLNLESNVLNTLSGLMLKAGHSGFAMRMIELSIKLKKQTNDVRGSGYSRYGRAKVHFYNKNYKEAEVDFRAAIDIHKKMNEYLGTSMSLRKLGVLYLETNKLDKAEKVVEESLKICFDHNVSMIKIKNFHTMYRINKAKNDNLNALSYLEKYQEAKESVLNTQTLKVIENYELINQMNRLENESIINKEKQKAIDKKNKDEKEAVRLKQEFLSIMSHEIRTPLNAITTIVSLLNKDIDKKNKELFDSLQFASKNLITIVNDILDFTKLDSNKAVLEKHATNFNVLCQNIYNLHVNLAYDKGLDLVLINTIPKSNNYELDQTKVSQILSNLIHNAIKFTGKGKVEFLVDIISQDRKYDYIKFSIKDSGEGILEKDIHQVFDSFSQVKPITTRKQGGTGLGLAIVKKLVKLHGGDIAVKSTPNKGSEFYFTLKLKRVEEQISNNNNIYTTLIGRKALIAEDTPINALLMKKLLSNWGILTTHVTNGQLAFEASKNEAFDFILMDIHMPEVNGFEATKMIKTLENKNKQTPVFAVTADVLTNEDKSKASLFDGILWKPLEIEKMFTTLTKALQ